MLEVKYPFCFYAEFEDGKSRNFSGFSEEDCICSIADFESKHGKEENYFRCILAAKTF